MVQENYDFKNKDKRVPIKEDYDWTHKYIKITDIRKLNKFYILAIDQVLKETPFDDIKETSYPLFVKNTIFEERLQSYFLTNDLQNIKREDILNLKWNMYITKGYHVKINEEGILVQYQHDKNKWYISFLEIDGELSTFSSIYRDKYFENKITQ